MTSVVYFSTTLNSYVFIAGSVGICGPLVRTAIVETTLAPPFLVADPNAAADHVFEDVTDLWDTLRRRATLSAAYPWLKPGDIPDDPSVN